MGFIVIYKDRHGMFRTLESIIWNDKLDAEAQARYYKNKAIENYTDNQDYIVVPLELKGHV